MRNGHSDNAWQLPADVPICDDLGTLSRLFAGDCVRPEQFYDPLHSAKPAGGVMALMRAVLEDAVECFQKQYVRPGPYTRQVGREAAVWLFNDDEQWPFSCLNICMVLNIDLGQLRRGLERWRQGIVAGTQPEGSRSGREQERVELAA